MNRVSKVVLISLGALAALLVAAYVGVNLYLQSPGTQARLQTQLSDALGMPVEITRVSFGLSGVQMSGVRIPQGAGALLQVPTFRAEYRVWPLLRKRLEVSNMILENPRVRWAQNAEGKWVLPVLPKKQKPEKIELPETAPKPPKDKKGMEVVLEKLEIRHGIIELVDAKDQRVAIANDVGMQYSLGKGGQMQGTFAAEQIGWENSFRFQNVRSKLIYDEGVVRLQDVNAEVAGGRAEAQLEIATQRRNSPFKGKLQVFTVDLAQLSADHGWAPNQARGKLDGVVDFEGNMRRPERAEGKGKLTLTDGQFSQLNLFQAVGTILQIPELADLRVRTGTAEFAFGGEKLELMPLVLDSGDLVFSATGTVRYDRRLELAAKLAASQRVWQSLPKIVSDHFEEADEQGRRGITFTVKGTTDRPRPNLVERVIGQRIGGQYEELLSTIFSGQAKKREEKERKKQQEQEEKRAKKEREKEKEKAKKDNE